MQQAEKTFKNLAERTKGKLVTVYVDDCCKQEKNQRNVWCKCKC